MRGAGALGCLCLLLQTVEAVSTTVEAGATASTPGISKSTEHAANSTTTSATATTGVENKPRSPQVPLLTTSATDSDGMTRTMGEGSSSMSYKTSRIISESQAPSATSIAASIGAESSTPSANPDTTPSTAWVSTSPMDTIEQRLTTGIRTKMTSEDDSFSIVSTTSSRTLRMDSTTSVAKGVITHGQTTSSAGTAAVNSVRSLSTETRPSTGGTTTVSASAGVQTPTGHTVSSLTTSEGTNARNRTLGFTTASHSMSSESSTMATDIAISTHSLTVSQSQLTAATGGSLSTSPKTTRTGHNSTSYTQSFSAQTVSNGSHLDSTEHVTTSPSQVSSTTSTHTAENYCNSMMCPLFSTCVSRQSDYVCQCPLGFYFQPPAACVTGKAFPGSLHLRNLSYSLNMENRDSLVFKTTAADIERVLSEILKNHSGYVTSIVEKLTNGSVMATVSNFFQQSSPVTSDNVTQSIQRFIRDCHDCRPLQKGDAYQETSLCGPDSCDNTTTTCKSSNGEFSCSCKDGYFKRFPMDRSCMACSSGYGLQDTTCVASKVPSSAPSYEQESYLRWPKQEALKIPRVTMSWDSSHIEMQENGNRNNLEESPVGNGNVVDANRMDSLRTFTCKNPTRYSYLCQGQDNPYFISDDHGQVNLK
ncbi:protein HEG isoform X2 [Microcaecilia unicolor]|uniref:Protein HEG-like isoform X2 n=1 Tax=Microcaecilia unicolor TaxID=1415580 RepID=A0A6P7ZSU9_9AMPH|nr:protein HEG-like isoform X2 [Microcaecilia unicolor]